MRLAPGIVKLGIMAVSALIPILLLASIYPLFVPGNIQVDIPETEEWGMEMLGTSMTLDIPLRIYNGASSPITDFSVHLVMNDSRGAVVAEDATYPLDIETGRWTDVPVHLDIDLSSFPTETLEAMAFSNETLGMSVGVAASYFYKLVKANVDVGSDMQIGPLISDIEIDLEHASMVHSGLGADLHVPFSFSAQGLLEGQQFTLECVLSNTSALLDQSSQSIQVSSSTAGEILFHLEQSEAQHLLLHEDDLTVAATFTVLDASLQQSYAFHWTPPGV